ncbi:MAG: hypothetical protein ACXW29_07390 [Thermoanaerobaculia bacterium]
MFDTVPAANETMRISLTTTGGLTGRGVGSVTVQANLALPKPKPTPPPKPTPDAITYTLTIDGQQWSWTDANTPDDCQAWADALLKLIR